MRRAADAPGADAGGVPSRPRRFGGREGLTVLVDARPLVHSGIGRYLREVVVRMLADARFGSVVMLGHPGEIAAFAAEQAGGHKVRAVAFPYAFYSPGAQARWMALLARGRLRADAAFFPHWDVPVGPLPAPAVVVVHDLGHFVLPELFPAWKRAAASVVLRRAVRRARRVMVVSEATAADLAARFPWAAARTRRAPGGVSPRFLLDSPPSLSAEVDALRPYLLCVGNRKAHKNMGAGVEVLARLRAEFPAMKLVIAGKDFGEDSGVLARAAELGVRGAVVVREPSDAELVGLYAGAEALLFPSVFEGFGLPVLEAMGCGTPVVASDRASIPEVAGGAALLVDPYDHAAMAESVRRVMTEDGLRADLVARGRERARAFSWDETARRVMDALVEVGSARSGD